MKNFAAYSLWFFFLVTSISAQNLVAYYPFNGNANDAGGANVNPTYVGSGVTLTTDRFGNAGSAYAFDGATGSYIRIPADAFPAGNRTISAWFNVPSVSNRPAILGYGGNGSCGTTFFMSLNLLGAGQYSVQGHCQNNAVGYSYPSEPINAWYHWVVTVSGSTQKIYVNGELKATAATFTSNTVVAGKDFSLGVIPYTNGSAPYTDVNVGYLIGKLDDIRIYNGALTDSQVTALYYSEAIAAPVLNSPSNNAIGQSLVSSLSWNSVANAASYGLQVSTMSGFATTFYSQSGLTSTTQTVGPLAGLTTYYWRADANAIAGGTGSWSGIWSFSTIIAPPAPPVLSSPSSSSANLPLTLTLSWNTSSTALSYGLQVSTASNFAATVQSYSGLTSIAQAVGPLANLTGYYWRVNASNSGGTGSWSSIWSFTTIPLMPPVPAMVSPSNGARFIPNQNIALTWGSVAGATSYRVQISTVSTFATSVLYQSGNIVSVLFAVSYPVSYWRVNASNAGGTSNWSAAWSFSINSPVLATDPLAIKSDMSLKNGTVFYSLAHPVQVEINLFDICGKKAFSIKYNRAAGSYRLPLSTRLISAGRYILHFKAGTFERRQAIVITR